MGLLWSWMEDLQSLAESNAPCLFFCANDYADVPGETAVHASVRLPSAMLSRPCLAREGSTHRL